VLKSQLTRVARLKN